MKGLISSLGDVAEFINGAAFKPEDWGDEGARIIRIQNLTDPTKPYNRTTRDVSERIQVQPEDLLVSWSATLGVFEWKGPDVGYLNQHIFRVVPDETKVDKRYLRHALELALLDMRKHLHGATMLHVNRGEFLSTKLYLPSLSEQRRIATILDKADALRTKRREALAQLDRLTQSIFVEMFGDPVTNPKGWRRLALGEIFGIARGGSPRPIDDYITDAADGVNWVMIGDTEQGGKYIWSTKKKIRPEGVKRSRLVKSGDFLLTNSMSFGRPYILKTSGCIHDGWLVLSPQITDFNADFFYTLLGSQAVFTEFSRRAAGATVKNLNIDLVASVEVAVPPLEEQRKFAKTVEAIEAMKSHGESSESQLHSLFGSLQVRAFAGAL